MKGLPQRAESSEIKQLAVREDRLATVSGAGQVGTSIVKASAHVHECRAPFIQHGLAQGACLKKRM